MKTKNFIPTLLALTIRLLVSSQTPSANSEHRILPVLGAKEVSASLTKKQSQNEKTEKAKKIISESSVTEPKVYPTIISDGMPGTKNNPAAANNLTGAATDNNSFNYYNNVNCYSTMLYAGELLKQADELLKIEATLRLEAKTKQGEEKTKLISSAAGLFKQAELKQIQASEIAGKIALENFAKNDIMINNMFITTLAGENTIDQARDLNSEAKYNIKLAKEMREEAYAMHGNSAKLGVMSNAEEKEALALGKQDAVITLLKSTACVHKMIEFYLAVK